MTVNTYKSINKTQTWGGLPRTYFIGIVIASMLSVTTFHSFRGLVPIMAVYAILAFLTNRDEKIIPILIENLKFKSSYFAD